jgi:hypothetical protein
MRQTFPRNTLCFSPQDIHILQCGVRRRPGRPMSTNADATHFAEVSDCFFSR